MQQDCIIAEDSTEHPRKHLTTVILKLFSTVFQQDPCAEMCVGHCSRSVGTALIPIAIICMVANVLLLFPDMKSQYLTERHVTTEAMLCSGIWASGLLVLVAARGFTTRYEKTGCCYFTAEVFRKLGYTCLAIVAAGLCFVVSGTGLTRGPLCLHNGTEGLKWERPLKPVKSGEFLYLYDPERWASACVEPQRVVIWNIVLFSVLMAASGLELVLCLLHLLTAILELMFGRAFCKNKVQMLTKSLPL
ncbi:transmembrane 4 L6 family member 5 isoform X1 [Pimephales promelas]|uniref:transmembrane 4 L6 family member 5 isoform X1 n=2 Tax=Pimephales promelas TaxID=90988 RepID=UPI0019554C0D|nr:transmembrane 4 L6 family member 5 isoform X1 [Pimephales promelas]